MIDQPVTRAVFQRDGSHKRQNKLLAGSISGYRYRFWLGSEFPVRDSYWEINFRLQIQIPGVGRSISDTVTEKVL